jgi:hypothetical protein
MNRECELAHIRVKKTHSNRVYNSTRERSDRSECYPVLEAIKGSVDCVHQFRRPLLSRQGRPSLQAPLRSRHPTLPRRRLTRTRRDRSRYPDRISRR